jgi:hypothetical protein
MSNYDSVDFFTDPSLVPDPHPYFDYLRSKNPVLRLPHYNVVAITGYDEATAVYKDPDSFSNIVALGGPFPPLPFEPEGDDLSAQIDAHRSQFPMNEHMVTMDPPDHTRARSILSRLLTPSRLKENEDFMWRLADRQLEEFLGTGECEFIAEYSKPFATLVIADLLGVPEEDHKEFRSVLGADRPGARVGALDHESVGINPLVWLDDKFRAYIEDTGSHRGGALGHLPVRGRPRDHRQAALGCPPGARRPARRPGKAARGPQPDSRVHRGITALRKPGQERLPAGAQVRHHRRCRHTRRHSGDGVAGRGQPRSTPV